MSSSNCCFLTCIQISQEAGQVLWSSHLFQNFPQFIVIHTVKGFGIVNKAEIDVFLELICFFHDPADVGNLISGSSAFSKTSLNIRQRLVRVSCNDLVNGNTKSQHRGNPGISVEMGVVLGFSRKTGPIGVYRRYLLQRICSCSLQRLRSSAICQLETQESWWYNLVQV